MFELFHISRQHWMRSCPFTCWFCLVAIVVVAVNYWVLNGALKFLLRVLEQVFPTIREYRFHEALGAIALYFGIVMYSWGIV